jgi:hypothetical protein
VAAKLMNQYLSALKFTQAVRLAVNENLNPSLVATNGVNDMLKAKSMVKNRIVTECKYIIAVVLLGLIDVIANVTLTAGNLANSGFAKVLLTCFISFCLALCIFKLANAADFKTKKVVPAGNTALYKVTPVPIVAPVPFVIKRTKVQNLFEVDPQQKELDKQRLHGLMAGAEGCE